MTEKGNNYKFEKWKNELFENGSMVVFAGWGEKCVQIGGTEFDVAPCGVKGAEFAQIDQDQRGDGADHHAQNPAGPHTEIDTDQRENGGKSGLVAQNFWFSYPAKERDDAPNDDDFR